MTPRVLRRELRNTFYRPIHRCTNYRPKPAFDFLPVFIPYVSAIWRAIFEGISAQGLWHPPPLNSLSSQQSAGYSSSCILDANECTSFSVYGDELRFVNIEDTYRKGFNGLCPLWSSDFRVRAGVFRWVFQFFQFSLFFLFLFFFFLLRTKHKNLKKQIHFQYFLRVDILKIIYPIIDPIKNYIAEN